MKTLSTLVKTVTHHTLHTCPLCHTSGSLYREEDTEYTQRGPGPDFGLSRVRVYVGQWVCRFCHRLVVNGQYA